MSIQYSVQPATTPNQAGKYFMRFEPKGTIRKEQIVKNIASKTLINPVDAEAVLDAIVEEIINELVAGNMIILDDFLGFTLSLESEHPITDPNYSIQLPGDKVRTNASLKNAVRDRVRQLLPVAGDFEKVTTRLRQPHINRIFNVITQEVGKFTPGGPIEITGVDLDLPADLATDTRNGVFFKSGTTETRATLYQSEGNLRIVCIVPGAVTAATVDIIVRTDYEATALREGKVSGIPKVTPIGPVP